jgi:hypothetical protein
MKQRGRPSANANVIPIDRGLKRLEPPADLSTAESELFRQTVAASAADHFVLSDLPLLISFVQATLFVRRAARGLASDAGLIVTWERAVKTQAMLATRLRLSPQSRADPKAVTRRQAAHRPSAYDLMTGGGDG